MVANPTGGSRTLLGIGSAMYNAAHEIVKNGMPLAADTLESAAADIEFTSGEYRIKGTDRAVSITALALKHPGKLDLDYRDRPKVPSTYPNGCHVCELEIDEETGSVEIQRYSVVDDVGTVINPLLLKGQIVGGVAQGVGQILMEDIQFDGDGQILTGSFMDYAMPRATDISAVEVKSNPVPTKTNPLGVKGAGEAGCVGAMPAVANALVDALSHLGIKHIEMPATPERLWRAISQANGKHAQGSNL
jgi:carbon-monoxide dehydrogenase large subunit